MQINNTLSIPQTAKTEAVKKHAVKITVPALLTSGAVMLSTKAPKGAKANVPKMTTRLKRAGIAGLVTAAVVAAINLVNKETIVNGVNKVKEVFRKTDGEKKLENVSKGEIEEVPTEPKTSQEPSEVQEDTKQEVPAKADESENPFANSENVKLEPIAPDKTDEKPSEEDNQVPKEGESQKPETNTMALNNPFATPMQQAATPAPSLLQNDIGKQNIITPIAQVGK